MFRRLNKAKSQLYSDEYRPGVSSYPAHPSEAEGQRPPFSSEGQQPQPANELQRTTSKADRSGSTSKPGARDPSSPLPTPGISEDQGPSPKPQARPSTDLEANPQFSNRQYQVPSVESQKPASIPEAQQPSSNPEEQRPPSSSNHRRTTSRTDLTRSPSNPESSGHHSKAKRVGSQEGSRLELPPDLRDFEVHTRGHPKDCSCSPCGLKGLPEQQRKIADLASWFIEIAQSAENWSNREQEVSNRWRRKVGRF
jgi:hypothetical protein